MSLVVPSVRRFRRLNLAGSLIATVYNVVFGIWPYAAMNAVITLIDLYWLLRLRGAAERRYSVCRVGAQNAVVTGLIDGHRAGTEASYPGALARLDGATCLLTLCDDEIVGLFAMRCADGEGHVVVDWVTDRFRDLKPGRALYADAALAGMGVRRLVVDPAAVADPAYFERVGFARDGAALVRTLA